MGGHTTYTEEMADELVNWLANGQTLREFCRQEGKPAWRTVYAWLDANEAFHARFARARELGQEAIFEDTLRIADTPMVGVTKNYKGDVIEVKEEDMLGHRKLQIETRLKLLAKWNPKKYGEKVETTHRGDPTAPLALVLNGSDVEG